MGIYEELRARGFIAQVTDENEIRELLYERKKLKEVVLQKKL